MVKRTTSKVPPAKRQKKNAVKKRTGVRRVANKKTKKTAARKASRRDEKRTEEHLRLSLILWKKFALTVLIFSPFIGGTGLHVLADMPNTPIFRTVSSILLSPSNNQEDTKESEDVKEVTEENSQEPNEIKKIAPLLIKNNLDINPSYQKEETPPPSTETPGTDHVETSSTNNSSQGVSPHRGTSSYNVQPKGVIDDQAQEEPEEEQSNETPEEENTESQEDQSLSSDSFIPTGSTTLGDLLKFQALLPKTEIVPVYIEKEKEDDGTSDRIAKMLSELLSHLRDSTPAPTHSNTISPEVRSIIEGVTQKINAGNNISIEIGDNASNPAINISSPVNAIGDMGVTGSATADTDISQSDVGSTVDVDIDTGEGEDGGSDAGDGTGAEDSSSQDSGSGNADQDSGNTNSGEQQDQPVIPDVSTGNDQINNAADSMKSVLQDAVDSVKNLPENDADQSGSDENTETQNSAAEGAVDGD